MTPDERKRGLRAAVNAKLKQAGPITAARSRINEVALLWEIIDSLVDEVGLARKAGKGGK